MKLFLRFLDDFLLVAGCACILYGVSLKSVILTWVMAGIMLIGFGVMVAAEKAKAQNVTAKPADNE